MTQNLRLMFVSALRGIGLGAVLTMMAGCGGSGGSSSCGSCGGGGGGSPTDVTIVFDGSAPTAVATQVGAGNFAAASLSGGKLTVGVPSGTTNYAVAYVCPPVQLAAPVNLRENFVHVWEAALTDGTSFSQSCGNGNSGFATGTLTGSVDASAIAGTSNVEVLAFNGTNEVAGAVASNAGSFSIAAPTGADRVEVLAYDSLFHLQAAKDLGSQTAPGAVNGGSAVSLGAADQVGSQPITYSNVPAGYQGPMSFASIVLGTAGVATLTTGGAAYPTLPAGALENGDTYSVISTVIATGTPSKSMTVSQTFTAAQPIAVVFPAAFAPVAPTAAAWPSFTISYSGFRSGSISDAVIYRWNTSGTTTYALDVLSTAAHQGASTSVAVPDLSGIAGFPAAPVSGSTAIWFEGVVDSSYPPGLGTPVVATVSQVGAIGDYFVP